MNTLSLIRWAGGKGKQLNDLLPLIPQSRTYVEPFGGGASVLLNRQRSEVEVYNDLDSALVNLFSVVRDPDTFTRFCELLNYTPYSRAEFERCMSHEGLADPTQRAVAFYVAINQSFSGKRLALPSEWSRSKFDNPAERWFNRVDKLPFIQDRIKNVQIECRDALDILQEWDSPETTFYCDPPYILDTRRQQKYYAIEPGDDYHRQLVDVLLTVKGCVVLSGYDHPIYHKLLDEGWWTDLYGTKATMQFTNLKEEQSTRQEIVYRNRSAADSAIKRPLFLDDTDFLRVVTPVPATDA